MMKNRGERGGWCAVVGGCCVYGKGGGEEKEGGESIRGKEMYEVMVRVDGCGNVHEKEREKGM